MSASPARHSGKFIDGFPENFYLSALAVSVAQVLGVANGGVGYLPGSRYCLSLPIVWPGLVREALAIGFYETKMREKVIFAICRRGGKRFFNHESVALIYSPG